MTSKFLTAATLTAAALAIFATDAWAGNNDHFASRRRDAELRRQASFQQSRTTWGGPTTSHHWSAPGHRHGPHCPATCACRGSSYFHHSTFHYPHVVFVPGHYEWFAGRLIYVPPRYVVVPQRHVHIEHRHFVK